MSDQVFFTLIAALIAGFVSAVLAALISLAARIRRLERGE